MISRSCYSESCCGISGSHDHHLWDTVMPCWICAGGQTHHQTCLQSQPESMLTDQTHPWYWLSGFDFDPRNVSHNNTLLNAVKNRTFLTFSLSTKSLYNTSNSLVLLPLKILWWCILENHFPDLLFKIIAHQSCEATSKYYCYKQNVNPWIAVIIEIEGGFFCLDTQFLNLTWDIWVNFQKSLFSSGLHIVLNVVPVYCVTSWEQI